MPHLPHAIFGLFSPYMALIAVGKAYWANAATAFSVMHGSVYGRFAEYDGKTPCSAAVYAGRLKEEMNKFIANQNATNAAHSSVYGVRAAYTSFLPSTSFSLTMGILLITALMGFPNLALAMGGEGLVGPLLSAALLFLVLLVGGIWAVMSLLIRGHWALIGLSLIFGSIGIAWEVCPPIITHSSCFAPSGSFGYVFVFLKWFLPAALLCRIFFGRTKVQDPE